MPMPMGGVVIRVDGTTENVEPARAADGWSLEELRRYTGSEYVEFVPLLNPDLHDMVLVVDEEGLLRQRELNAEASVIAGRPLVGDVLLVDVASL